MIGALAFLRAHAAEIAVFAPMGLGALAFLLPRSAAAIALICALGFLALAAATATGPVGGNGLAALDALYLCVLAVAAGVTMTAAPFSLSRDLHPRAAGEAMCLMMIAMGAAFGAAVSSEALVAVQYAGVSVLAGVGATSMSALSARRAAATAAQSLIGGVLALAAAVCGAALTTSATGAPEALGPVLLLAGLAMFAGLAPFHMGAANAASEGPFGAGAGTAVIVRLGAFAALARAGADLMQGAGPVAVATGYMLAALGGASAIVGAVQAIGASDMRRLAAHGLTAHLGLALLGLATGSEDGAAAALFMSVVGAVVALGLVCAAASSRATGGPESPVAALDGLSRRQPLVAGAFVIAALGLAGAPMTAPFLGKWMSVEATLARGWYWAAALVVATSFAAVFVAGRLVARIYFSDPILPARPGPNSARAFAPALAVSVAATVLLGWNATPLLEAARTAAQAMAGAP